MIRSDPAIGPSAQIVEIVPQTRPSLQKLDVATEKHSSDSQQADDDTHRVIVEELRPAAVPGEASSQSLRPPIGTANANQASSTVAPVAPDNDVKVSVPNTNAADGAVWADARRVSIVRIGSAQPTIVGNWKAVPDEGIEIDLALRADSTFTWRFTVNDEVKVFTGKYRVDSKSLVLTRQADGNSMDGTVALCSLNRFQFRIKDAEPEDPGLTFNHQ